MREDKGKPGSSKGTEGDNVTLVRWEKTRTFAGDGKESMTAAEQISNIKQRHVKVFKNVASFMNLWVFVCGILRFYKHTGAHGKNLSCFCSFATCSKALNYCNFP